MSLLGEDPQGTAGVPEQLDDSIRPQGRGVQAVVAKKLGAIETQQTVEGSDPEPAVWGLLDVGQVVDRQTIVDRPHPVDESPIIRGLDGVNLVGPYECRSQGHAGERKQANQQVAGRLRSCDLGAGRDLEAPTTLSCRRRVRDL